MSPQIPAEDLRRLNDAVELASRPIEELSWLLAELGIDHQIITMKDKNDVVIGSWVWSPAKITPSTPVN